MPGTGTLINTAAILLGGLLGLGCGKLMKEHYQEALMKVCGLCVIFVGISGTLEKMFTITSDGITSGGSMMVIGSFSIGTLLGEFINIEGKLNQFGEWLKQKTGNSREKLFVDGFVCASLTVCIGAMAIVGAIQDGIYGDYSTLTLKAILDLIIIWVMTTSMGKGCIFSAIPVALLQGSVTFLSSLLEPLMTPEALQNLSLTGSMLIFCVGINLIWEKTFRVANMLPTIVIAVIWALAA